MKQFTFNGKTIKTTIKNGEPVFHAGDLVESLGFMRSHPQKKGTWMYKINPFYFIDGSNKYWSEESIENVCSVLEMSTKRESSNKLLDAIKHFNDNYSSQLHKSSKKESQVEVDSRLTRVIDSVKADGEYLVIKSEGKEYKRLAIDVVAANDKTCCITGKPIKKGDTCFYAKISSSDKYKHISFHAHKSCFEHYEPEQEQEVFLDSPDSNLENIKPHGSIAPLYCLSAIQIILMLIIIFNDLSK